MQCAGMGAWSSAHLCVNLARPLGVWVMHVAHTQRGQLSSFLCCCCCSFDCFSAWSVAVRANSFCHLAGVLVRTAATIPSRMRPTDNLLDGLPFQTASTVGWPNVNEHSPCCQKMSSIYAKLGRRDMQWVFPKNIEKRQLPFLKSLRK